MNINFESDVPGSVPPTVLVSKQLPAGHFIANGQAVITVLDQPHPWDVWCYLIDTPDTGTPVSDFAEWQGVPQGSKVLIPNNLATNTLGFTLAIDSPNSASTLTISCTGFAEFSAPGIAVNLYGMGTLTAVQTTANG
jgi:hypothetical protein